MMNNKIKLHIGTAALALTGVGFFGAALTIAPTPASAVRQCIDSNGSAPGGSVYLDYRVNTFYCNVTPPQRLHLTHTPSLAACNDAGGRFAPAVHICFDVDY